MADKDDSQPMSEEEEEDYLQIRPPQRQAGPVRPTPEPTPGPLPPPIPVPQQDDDDFEQISDDEEEDDFQVRTQSPQTRQVQERDNAGFEVITSDEDQSQSGPIRTRGSHSSTARHQPYTTHRPSGRTSGRRGTSPTQTTGPFAREECDIYIHLVRGTDRSIQAVFDTINQGDSIVDNGYGYHYSPDCQEYTVRVPAMMYYRHPSTRLDEKLRDFRTFMVQQYRHQATFHLVGVYNAYTNRYNSSGLTCERMCYGATPFEGLEHLEIDNPNKYGHMNMSFHPVTNAYPCYRPKGVKGQGGLRMVLGLCFTLKNIGAIRSFGRFDYPDLKNEFVRDIYEDDISPPEKDQVKSYMFQKNFSKAGERDKMCANAFYVCQGAKLILTDTRFIGASGKPQTELRQDASDHCRSLFLPGSLVVVRAPFQVGFDVKKADEKDAATYELDLDQFLAQHTSIPGEEATDLAMVPLDSVERGIDNDVRTVDPNDKDGPRVGDLSHQSKVIFLGPADSQYNSACWTLNVRRSKYYHEIMLKAPEGGRIVDIAPWNTGMALVRYRHDYERLFAGVLEPVSSDREFEAPPSNHNNYFLKRLLGIPILTGRRYSCAIDPKYDIIEGMGNDYLIGGHDENDNDLRRYVQPLFIEEGISGTRYLDQYTNLESAIAYRNWHYPSDQPDHGSGGEVKTYDRLPVPPEPLYPPIYREETNSIHYLDQNVKVKRNGAFDPAIPLEDLKFNIDGMDGVYEWGFVNNAQGSWMMSRNATVLRDYRRMIEGKNENVGEWCKTGLDYHYYCKEIHPIGQPIPPNMTTKIMVLKQCKEESLEELEARLKAKQEELQEIDEGQNVEDESLEELEARLKAKQEELQEIDEGQNVQDESLEELEEQQKKLKAMLDQI